MQLKQLENEEGVADDSYCGFVSYGGSWWEIRNGVIDFSVNSVDEGIVNGECGMVRCKLPGAEWSGDLLTGTGESCRSGFAKRLQGMIFISYL